MESALANPEVELPEMVVSLVNETLKPAEVKPSSGLVRKDAIPVMRKRYRYHEKWQTRKGILSMPL